MTEELENEFKGIISIKSAHWVALFLAIQAVLLTLMLKLNLRQYALADSASGFFLAAVPQAFVLLTLSLLILKRLGVDFARTWQNWSTNLKHDIKLGALYFTGCLALILLINLTGYPWTLPKDKSSQLIFNAIHWSTPSFLGFMLLTCVITPLAEELFYKRLLYVGVRKEMPAVKAIILCSLLFALIHPVSTFLLVLTGNLLTYYLYEKHKRLFANIVLHSLMNFFVILNKAL